MLFGSRIGVLLSYKIRGLIIEELGIMVGDLNPERSNKLGWLLSSGTGPAGRRTSISSAPALQKSGFQINAV